MPLRLPDSVLTMWTAPAVTASGLRRSGGWPACPPGAEPLATEQVDSLRHPDDRQGFPDKLQASLAPEGSGEFESEHRLLHADGTVRWVKTKGRTFFTGAGRDRRAPAATGIVMDVTASQAAGQALAESREELDNLVESAIDSIVTIDAEQRIIRFNPSAVRMFGCTAEDALGSSVERFMPERYRAEHPEKVRRFAESGAPAHALDAPKRFIGLRANDEEFPFESTITKLTKANEALDGAIRGTGGRETQDDLPTLQGDRTQPEQLLQNLIDNGLKYRGKEPPSAVGSSIGTGVGFGLNRNQARPALFISLCRTGRQGIPESAQLRQLRLRRAPARPGPTFGTNPNSREIFQLNAILRSARIQFRGQLSWPWG